MRLFLSLSAWRLTPPKDKDRLRALMRLFWHEFKPEGTTLNLTEKDLWLFHGVIALDEGDPTPLGMQRKLKAKLDLRMVDEVAMVTGSIKTDIQLLCSRCAQPYLHAVEPQFSAMYCRDPELAGIDVQHHDGTVAAGRVHGWARHEHDYSIDDETSGNVDITYISEDSVELTDVLSEQLRLEIPFQPLCQETCKGLCGSCGTNLNLGKCACDKLVRSTPFTALESILSKPLS
jgi:uncharacterized protein